MTAEKELEKKLTVPGGWTQFKDLTASDKKVFDEAMKHHVGATFTPEKVSKQIVNGTNYRFFCYGMPATHEPHRYPAIVKIHAPIHGEPEITEIERVVL